MRPVRPIFQLALAVACGVAALSRAQVVPMDSSPAPLLEQLSAQTVALHRAVAASMVHVHWPEVPVADVGPAEEMYRKWEQRLEPSVKQKLLDQIAAVKAMHAAALAQATQADPLAGVRQMDRGSNLLRSIDPFTFADLAPLGMPGGRNPASVTVGLIVDDHGLIVVPEFVDRDWAAQRPIRVTLPAGGEGDATFIGADRPTGLTVLRLTAAPQPSTSADGTPTQTLPAVQPPSARLADAAPADGAIVLVVSDDSEHLALWRSGDRAAGFVALTDGRIAGLGGNGQFLPSTAAAPIIRQLADTGTVRRCLLGVHVSEVRPDDLQRRFEPLLADHAAMRVEKVLANSIADHGGLRPDDFILAINNAPVGDLPTFAAAIATCDGPTEIRIIRHGALATLSVDLTRP